MHAIALFIYGTEMRQELLCIKCTQLVPTILLRLFGNHASDLTSSHSPYQYIYIPGVQYLVHSFLILQVTDEEKKVVETITWSYRSSPQTFLWQDSHWYEFPFGDGSRSGHRDYRLVSAATCATSYPTVPGSDGPFVIPSALGSAPSSDITIQRSAREGKGKTWWWIGGNTKPVKDILDEAGARWSRRRQQWYYIGEVLPVAIQALGEAKPSLAASADLVQSRSDSGLFPNNGGIAISQTVSESHRTSLELLPENANTTSAPELVRYTATPVAAMPAESGSNEESVMRSVQTDDVQAALIAHIHDWERGKPILIDFVGSRNAIKQLLAKPFNPGNIGRGDGVGFILVNGSSFSNFRLPDLNYKAISASLKNRAIEGRIVSLDATTAAPKQECYVLVSGPIRIPETDDPETVAAIWQRYVRYRQAPNRPEFARYEPTAWTTDLYNVYQALRVRLGRPLHIGWMPWLFQQVADQQLTSPKLGLSGVMVCKYIGGYITPKAAGAVEQGAYRLTCSEVSELWGEVIMANPQRAQGIVFKSDEKGAVS
ncbi:MAG: hypothetical protein ABI947_19305 [Chloroflexota bacterium]